MSLFPTEHSIIPHTLQSKDILAYHSSPSTENTISASQSARYQQFAFPSRRILCNISRFITPLDALRLARISRRAWQYIVEDDPNFWQKVYEYRFSGSSEQHGQERGFLDAFMAADLMAEPSVLPDDFHFLSDPNHSLDHSGSTASIDDEPGCLSIFAETPRPEHSGPYDHMDYDPNATLVEHSLPSIRLRRKRNQARPLGTRASTMFDIHAVQQMIAHNTTTRKNQEEEVQIQNDYINESSLQVSEKSSFWPSSLSDLSDIESCDTSPSVNSFSVTAEFAFSNEGEHYEDMDNMSDNNDYEHYNNTMCFNEEESTILEDSEYEAVNLQVDREARRRRPRAKSLSAATLVANACSLMKSNVMHDIDSPKASPLSPSSISSCSSAHSKDPKASVAAPMDWLAAGQMRARMEANLRYGKCNRRLVQPPNDAQGPIFLRASFGRWIAVDVGTRAYLLEIRRKRSIASRSAFISELLKSNDPHRYSEDSFFIATEMSTNYQDNSIYRLPNHSDTSAVARIVRPYAIDSEQKERAPPAGDITNITVSTVDDDSHIMSDTASSQGSATERREAWLKHWTRLSFGQPLSQPRALATPLLKTSHSMNNRSFDCEEATLIEEFEDDSVQYIWHPLALDVGATDQYGWTGNGVVQVLLNDRYMVRMLCTSNNNNNNDSNNTGTETLRPEPMRVIHVWRLNRFTNDATYYNDAGIEDESSRVEPCYAVLVPRDAVFEQLLGRWLSIILPNTVNSRTSCQALRVIDLESGLLCPGEVPLNPDDSVHLHAVGEERAFVYQCTLRDIPSNVSTSANDSTKSKPIANELLLWRLWQFSAIVHHDTNSPQLIGQSVLCITSSAKHEIGKRAINLHSSFIDTSRVLIWSERGWLAVHHLRANSFLWESFGEPLANVALYSSSKRLMLMSARQARAVVVRLTNGLKAGASSSFNNSNKHNGLPDVSDMPLPPIKPVKPKPKLDTVLSAPSCHIIPSSVPMKPTKKEAKKANSNSTNSNSNNGTAIKTRSIKASRTSTSTTSTSTSTATKRNASNKETSGNTIYWPESSIATHIIGSLFCRADHGVGGSPIWLMDVKTGGGRVGLIRPDKRPLDTPETWAPAVDTRVNVMTAGPCLVDVYQRNAQLVLWDFMDML
ncbi:hypothetical protein BDF22DRAFT_662898 [Syncephalis plumigaleata]|nr:hypothetical protein BDF22DRAFT_662898 [Syncephalis plumigaleata]